MSFYGKLINKAFLHSFFSRLKRLSHLRRLLKQFSSSFFLSFFFLPLFFENRVLCGFALLRGSWTYLDILGRAWARLGALGHAWARLGVLGRAWARLGALGRAWAWFRVVLLGFA